MNKHLGFMIIHSFTKKTTMKTTYLFSEYGYKNYMFNSSVHRNIIYFLLNIQWVPNLYILYSIISSFKRGYLHICILQGFIFLERTFFKRNKHNTELQQNMAQNIRVYSAQWAIFFKKMPKMCFFKLFLPF